MGVFRRGSKLWVRYKGPDGTWVNKRTPYAVGQERQAERAFSQIVDRVKAGVELLGVRKQPITVREYAEQVWFPERRKVVSDWASDEGRMRLHVFPRIGAERLEDVRARHLAVLVKGLRATELAPRSIRNIYGVLRAMFRDACIEELVSATPCILTKRQLGEIVDADPEWRPGAVYTRAELQTLLADARVPLDRRVMYALQGIGGLRHGEAAGLRWRHLEADLEPLGRLVIATSYNKGHTKTSTPRFMPVHPTLAKMLEEWRRSGWVAMIGRAPGLEDLVVPTPKPTNKGPRVALGSVRSDHYSYKRLVSDLKALGFRHRRGHDLRRTFISLARSDGANKDILRRGTHKPPKEVIEGYTSFEWDVLCREVAKLQLRPASPLVLVTGDVTDSAKPSIVQGESMWRRRESKPWPRSESDLGSKSFSGVSVGVGRTSCDRPRPPAATRCVGIRLACNGVTGLPEEVSP